MPLRRVLPISYCICSVTDIVFLRWNSHGRSRPPVGSWAVPVGRGKFPRDVPREFPSTVGAPMGSPYYEYYMVYSVACRWVQCI